MAIKTSTTTGAWDTGATWVGGAKPANGDSVVIATGHVVTFDADLSGDGIDLAGLTITGTLTADTTAGDYTLLCSADIVGAGTFNIGSSGADYPATCTFLIDFDSTASSIDGTAGLTCNFYCVNPTNPVIELTGVEAIAQTELGVTTDVTGDTWAVGDAVRIDNVDSAVNSEARTIAAGGISSDHLDITAGLTAEKIAGSKVILITRNIKITGSTGYVVDALHDSNLGCEISGCTYGLNYSYSNTISGSISGCDQGLYSSYSNTISGTISGCVRGLYFSYSNTLYAVDFTSTTTENSGYANDVRSMPWAYTPSYNHDAVAGAFKAWTRGGAVLSQTTSPPSGYSTYYEHACVDVDNYVFRQEKISLDPGQTLTVKSVMQLPGGENLSAAAPTIEIIDASADPLWGTGESALAVAAMPVDDGSVTSWQEMPTISYKNAGSIPMVVVVRAKAKHATADVNEAWWLTRTGESGESGAAGSVNASWSWSW